MGQFGTVEDIFDKKINGVRWVIRKDNKDVWVVKDGVFYRECYTESQARQLILDES